MGRPHAPHQRPHLVVFPALPLFRRPANFLSRLALFLRRRPHPQTHRRLPAGCSHLHDLHRRHHGIQRHPPSSSTTASSGAASASPRSSPYSLCFRCRSKPSPRSATSAAPPKQKPLNRKILAPSAVSSPPSFPSCGNSSTPPHPGASSPHSPSFASPTSSTKSRFGRSP